MDINEINIAIIKKEWFIEVGNEINIMISLFYLGMLDQVSLMKPGQAGD